MMSCMVVRWSPLSAKHSMAASRICLRRASRCFWLTFGMAVFSNLGNRDAIKLVPTEVPAARTHIANPIIDGTDIFDHCQAIGPQEVGQFAGIEAKREWFLHLCQSALQLQPASKALWSGDDVAMHIGKSDAAVRRALADECKRPPNRCFRKVVGDAFPEEERRVPGIIARARQHLAQIVVVEIDFHIAYRREALGVANVLLLGGRGIGVIDFKNACRTGNAPGACVVAGTEDHHLRET